MIDEEEREREMNSDRIWKVAKMAGLAAAVMLGAAWIASPAGAVSKNFTEQMINTSFQLNYNCSATVIKSEKDEKTKKVETKLLTASHCVTKGKPGKLNASVFDDKWKVIEERNVIYDVEKSGSFGTIDLAVIKLRDTTNLYPVVGVADKIRVEMGDEVWAVGFPLGAAKTITNGLFGGYQPLPLGAIDPTTIYLRSTPDLAPGNSGGGLFQFNESTLNYELIGVTSAGVPTINHVGLYVPLSDIRKFIGLDRDDKEIRIFAPGFWEVAR